VVDTVSCACITQTHKQRDNSLHNQRDKRYQNHNLGAGKRRQSASKEAIKRHRKRAQLVTQISQSVQLYMADMEDEDLCTLTYSHVELIGNGEHLCVVMCAPLATQEEPVEIEVLQRKLDAIAPDVRMEVAHDIHRKRAPLISFLVVPN
jgi:hypothetical protein